jgi:ribosomal protein S18 acetylase RimI-like enzyme
MDNYILTNAIKQDVDKIYELIKKRIKWMDDNNIHQWNKTDYLATYPKKYFEEKMAIGQLYTMKSAPSGKVVGAVVLLEEDKRWNADGSKSYYIHNLVSNTEISGIGREIICLCEKMAIENGKDLIRLDCQESNSKLKDFYYRLGFKYVGYVQEGSYFGIKLEKKLIEP